MAEFDGMGLRPLSESSEILGIRRFTCGSTDHAGSSGNGMPLAIPLTSSCRASLQPRAHGFRTISTGLAATVFAATRERRCSCCEKPAASRKTMPGSGLSTPFSAGAWVGGTMLVKLCARHFGSANVRVTIAELT
jgi:hypothetical protein